MRKAWDSGVKIHKQQHGGKSCIMEAKKYLEEVMGIVEDEEFNKRRRRLLKSAKNKSSSKQSTLQSNSNLYNNTSHPSCLTQASAI